HQKLVHKAVNRSASAGSHLAAAAAAANGGLLGDAGDKYGEVDNGSDGGGVEGNGEAAAGGTHDEVWAGVDSDSPVGSSAAASASVAAPAPTARRASN